MVSVVLSPAPLGLEAGTVRVEVDLRPGLPSFAIVGLPDTAVQEARERVRSGIANQAYAIPGQRVVVNLAPGGLPKVGPQYDLPIALGVLAASGQISPELLDGVGAAGELALDGSLRSVPGTLAMAEHARSLGWRRLVLSESAAPEAALVSGVAILPATGLRHAVDLLGGHVEPALPVAPLAAPSGRVGQADLSEVRGQPKARRALEIAAAGSHSLLFEGPPGGGKTMLARRLTSILPSLEPEEALEVTRIFSAAGLRSPDDPPIYERPFRDPHHSASIAALVGGGPTLRPGEISLAHRGVLFLDEIAAFAPSVLDALRTPLQDRGVTVARAQRSARYPADALLIAAGNPCPCGFSGDPERPCVCAEARLSAYRSRLSGPLIDRIALTVSLPRLDPAVAAGEGASGEPSAPVRARVARARRFATERDPDPSVPSEVRDHLIRAAGQLALTGRACVQVLDVARTIADLAGTEQVGPDHLVEALGFQRSSPYG